MLLDLRHEECPVPTMKTLKALGQMSGSADGLTVVLDDAVCAADIPHHARRMGYQAETRLTGPSEWTIELVPGRKPESR